jgi:hypothetical protein
VSERVSERERQTDRQSVMPATWSLEDTLYLEELTRTSSVYSSFIDDSAMASRTCSAK